MECLGSFTPIGGAPRGARDEAVHVRRPRNLNEAGPGRPGSLGPFFRRQRADSHGFAVQQSTHDQESTANDGPFDNDDDIIKMELG